MAGPAAAGVRGERGVLWDGTIPSACDPATIMGCLCTYGGLPPWKYYGMRRAERGGGGGVIMGCRCSPGRGGRLRLRPGFLAVPAGTPPRPAPRPRCPPSRRSPGASCRCPPPRQPRGPLARTGSPLPCFSAVITNKAGRLLWDGCSTAWGWGWGGGVVAMEHFPWVAIMGWTRRCELLWDAAGLAGWGCPGGLLGAFAPQP